MLITIIKWYFSSMGAYTNLIAICGIIQRPILEREVCQIDWNYWSRTKMQKIFAAFQEMRPIFLCKLSAPMAFRFGECPRHGIR